MKPEHISDLDWQLIKNKYKNLEDIKEKINNHYPVQYLIGNVEFINTIIKVDERVLIPRFETEFLVQKTLEKIKELSIKNPKILELGTGSGCISIALKKNIDSSLTAVDNSTASLKLAKENAIENQVHINFILNDMLNVSYENYDVLISNPPYIAYDEKVGTETKYEPQNALFAPNDGLFFYEGIIKKIKETKNKPKLIAFEIGYLQGQKIYELAQKYIKNYICIIEKDLALKDRYVFLILNE